MTGNGPSLGSTRGDGYIDQLVQIQIEGQKRLNISYFLFFYDFFDFSIFVFVSEENLSKIFSIKSRTILTSGRQGDSDAQIVPWGRRCPSL